MEVQVMPTLTMAVNIAMMFLYQEQGPQQQEQSMESMIRVEEVGSI